MARQVILITGGARAGKSIYAEARAAALGRRRVYIATAEAKDEEMAGRIAEHRNRRGNEWATIEEPESLPEALMSQHAQADVTLVDCLTLWLSNLLVLHGAEFATRRVDALAEAIPRLDFHLILVTNEIGWGIVPDNALARQFRDLAGWANQRIGSLANEVILMVAGVPMILKR